jgi:Uncharacterized protein conserved in bacteria (DUF2330)
MISRLSFFLFLFALMGPVLGDGGYVSKSVLEPVEIPRQMAALSYAEGRETLTVWNTVRAADQELAWVLPLPAVPDVVQETPAAAFRVLQMACAPRVNVDGGAGFVVVVVSIFVAFLAWVFLFERRPLRGMLHYSEWIMVLAGLFLAYLLFHGPGKLMGGGTATSAVGVEVLQVGQVGNYETTVVRGDSPEALSQWLESHGFASFDEVGKKAIGEYVAEQWVFLCAKLKKSTAGEAGTHPLTVRFPSPELVYPMRLTRGAGTVPVDLFVVGENWVADPSGRLAQVITVDENRRTDWGWFSCVRAFRQQMMSARETGEPNELLVPVGRDLLLDALVSQGRCLTHLQGTFSPGSDWSDIKFMAGAEIKEPRNLVTPRHLLALALSYTMPIGSGLMLFMGFMARRGSLPGKRPARRWGRSVLLAIAVSYGMTLLVLSLGMRIVPAEQTTNQGRKGADSFTMGVVEWLRSLGGKIEFPNF